MSKNTAEQSEQQGKNLTFLSGINAEYVAHLYGEFLGNSGNVDQSWKEFFEALDDNELGLLQELNGASWTPEENRKASRKFDRMGGGAGFIQARTLEAVSENNADSPAGLLNDEASRRATRDSIAALQLIRAYRVRGHLLADLDPLQLKEKEYHPELDPAHYGFKPDDYNRKIYIGGSMGMEEATLDEVVTALRETYCKNIGIEFMHLSDPEEKSWLQKRIEAARNRTDFDLEDKKEILERLTAAEGFEQYLHKKYPGTKRFGIDGGEALIPCIEQIMKRGGQLGLEEINLGMAHRGRLNVLANVMGKPFATMFAEFMGKSTVPKEIEASGDVKYHMGMSSDRDFDGNNIHLSLNANPSHLEFVNPVVTGKVRSKQVQRGDIESKAVLPLLLHGDAAFAGQGIIAETLMIAELPGYRVGGTIHIVINNQIGFTTMPMFSRSGPYCTDVAKMLHAPIIHVNGDDAEAVVHVSRLSTEFRQKFGRDIVIDLFCYRRYGHNEGDEPAFTQPIMYQKIAQHKSARAIYEKKLIADNVITEAEAKAIYADFEAELDIAFKEAEDFEPKKADYLEGAWSEMSVADAGPRRGQTAIAKDELTRLIGALTKVPEGFNANSKLLRLLNNKTKMLESGEGYDWATAEALAFGSLLDDGFAVRLSGQDVGRGTFSHRHATWYDQVTNDKYMPLQNLSSDQPRFEAHDSPLSEMAVLGFEYGYASADPNTLTIWEAQFGDFANGAQVIIDQFISSGEVKWLRMSGLTLLLPHGFEGQGPEHSSARLERFLQLAAEDNWQVCNCTTPANYFHALRRQMVRDFRKPLIVMAPKSLLRHKLVQSTEDEFTEGSFHRFLWDDDYDDLVVAEKMKRVVLCSGKVYYDLLAERRERGIKDVMILRLEQIYPFATEELSEELAPYKNAEFVWCQEEPQNQGAWHFVDRRIEETLEAAGHKGSRPLYVGRKEAASVATGLASCHKEEQAQLVDEALSV